MTEEATIKIHRSRQPVIGWRTSFNIVVDGATIGTIGNGEDQVFKLSIGNHSVVIEAKNSCRSKKVQISLSPGDIKTLDCGYVRPFPDVFALLIPAPILLWAGLTARPFAQFPALSVVNTPAIMGATGSNAGCGVLAVMLVGLINSWYSGLSNGEQRHCCYLGCAV